MTLDRTYAGPRLRAAGILTGLVALSSMVSASFALPEDKAGAEQFLEIVGEGFRVRETEHFAIAYETSYEVLRPLIGRLEGTFNAVQRFCEGRDLMITPLSDRLRIVLFDDSEGFRRFAVERGSPSAVASGVYWPDSNVAAFLNTLRLPEIQQISQQIERVVASSRRPAKRQRTAKASRAHKKALQRQASELRSQRDIIVERFNRFTIQHEAAHQVLFNFGVHKRNARNPVWLVEGLACQFEIPQTGKSGGTRQINQMRLGDLRNALGLADGVKKITEADYQTALKSKNIVSLQVLVTDPAVFTGADSNIVFRYAQAWGLVYFLSRERKAEFGRYIRSLANRPAEEALDSSKQLDYFVRFFGPAGNELEREWIESVAKLRFTPDSIGR